MIDLRNIIITPPTGGGGSGTVSEIQLDGVAIPNVDGTVNIPIEPLSEAEIDRLWDRAWNGDNPITSFDISGNDTISAVGSNQYLIDSILPSDYNVGISSLAASISSLTSGEVEVVVNGTTGVTLEVVEMPSASETITLTVTATLEDNSTVVATKSITLQV